MAERLARPRRNSSRPACRLILFFEVPTGLAKAELNPMMSTLCLRSVALLALLIPALALTSAAGGPVILYLTAFVALVTLAANVVRRWEPFA